MSEYSDIKNDISRNVSWGCLEYIRKNEGQQNGRCEEPHTLNLGESWDHSGKKNRGKVTHKSTDQET